MPPVFTFGKDLWDPSHRFTTSWLLPPWLLFACRALMTLYAFTVLFFIIGWECTHPSLGGCTAAGDDFSYFTHLSYWGLAFYMLFASIHTLTYARTGTPLLDRFPRPLQALHSLLYSSVVVFPFITTIVYWGILYSSPWFPVVFNAWSGLSQHALNSAFALFEILAPRTLPMPFVHIPFLILLLALYLALAYLTHATKGFYTYGFLDPGQKGGRGLVAGYVFGIAAGCAVIFLVVWGVVWLRRWVTEKKLGMDGKVAHERSWRGEDAEQGAVPGAAVKKERSPFY